MIELIHSSGVNRVSSGVRGSMVIGEAFFDAVTSSVSLLCEKKLDIAVSTLEWNRGVVMGIVIMSY